MQPRSDAGRSARRRRQRGSALVIALLMTFILTLLGASFLMMARTESRIAQNETLAAQARYAARAGALVVKGWFDRPGTAIGFPPTGAIDRGQREILDETDPYQAVLGPGPLYKEDTDTDGDGVDDLLFERPYRGSLIDALMGTAAGPDMVIDDAGADAERTFLDGLSASLFGDYPSIARRRARVSRIAVRAPPYRKLGAVWVRHGVATVEVTARIYDGDQAVGEVPGPSVAAEHTITVVLNELPYATPVLGPLHACGDLRLAGRLPARWGTVTVLGDVLDEDPPFDPDDYPTSIPRCVPSGPRLEKYWTDDPAHFGTYHDRYDGEAVDPWLRVVVAGDIHPTSTLVQFEPPAWGCPEPPGETHPSPPEPCCDHSNLFHNHPLVLCPAYDYDFWKAAARSRAGDVYYFVPVGPDQYLEDGAGDPGTAVSFQEATDGREGVFFFDTADGLPPRDDDGDGAFDNLAEEVHVSGGWTSSGFVFLNAGIVANLAPPVATATLRAPGEPYLDTDGDEAYTPGVDPWINLAYPASLAAPIRIEAGGPPPWVRDGRGAPFDAAVSFRGILAVAGHFEAVGQGVYYGSVIAREWIRIDGTGTHPEFLWDASITEGTWPPPGSRVPRVTITGWDDWP